MTVARLGAVKFGSEVTNEVTGRMCEYIDVFKHLPKSAQEEIIAENDGKKPDGVFAWDCVRVTNEEFFEDSVEDNCKKEGYSSTCLAKVNKRGANGGFTDSTTVALVSDIPKGTCEAVRGNTVAGFFAKSLVKCGIGENGLNPGEEVTFRFFAVVPTDTPVINPDDLEKSQEIQTKYSFSQSCLDSQFPQQCHTIYAGVFPIKTGNLMSWFVDNTMDTLSVGACGFQKLWSGSGIDFTDCARSRTEGISTIGEPIWEGRGTFFVVGADLEGRIQMILNIGLLLGAFTGVITGGGKK